MTDIAKRRQTPLAAEPDARSDAAGTAPQNTPFVHGFFTPVPRIAKTAPKDAYEAECARGRAHFEQNRLRDASLCYVKAIRENPHRAEAYVGIGEVLATKGKGEMAMRSFDKALEIDPESWEAYASKGLLFVSMGKFRSAIRCYDNVLRIDPGSVPALVNKGWALHWLEKYKTAIKCCDRALRMNAQEHPAYICKGSSLHKLGRHESALECCNRALKIKPRLMETHILKTECLIKLERVDEVLEQADAMLRLDSEFARAHFFKGFGLSMQHQHESALACAKRALEIDPEYIAARMLCAECLMRLTRFKEAIEMYRGMPVAEFKSAEVQCRMGCSLLMLGKYEAALGCIDEALRQDPDSTIAQDLRARCQGILNRK